MNNHSFPLDVLKRMQARGRLPGDTVYDTASRRYAIQYAPTPATVQEFVNPPPPPSRSAIVVGEPKFTPVKNGQFPNGTSITRDRNVSAPTIRAPRLTAAARRRQAIDGTVGPLSAIAGGAALLNPAALPVAAGLGIGYGVYKLGEGLGIW